MTDVHVTVEDRVATLTMDRPPVNALSSPMYDALGAALDELARDRDVSVVVLASAGGRAFCAGADVAELASLTGPAATAADSRRQQTARSLFDALLDLPQPTIAAIDGPAIGAGAVLASCCDIRLASARAWFQLPEVDVGRCGGGRHLMRHLPQTVVRRMYFTGQPIGADIAAAYGFVECVPDGVDVLAEANAVARAIASKSPIALRLGKEALNAAESVPVKAGYALEQEYTLRLARTADAQEALAARREKRVPRFAGR
jgi:enoyl-CoA hydratase/carnithine racemase